MWGKYEKNFPKGLTVSSLKKHYSLIPLHFFCFGGVFMGLAYFVRTCMYHPALDWNTGWGPNPREPWEYYKDKQYHFYSPVKRKYFMDPNRPNYRDE